MTRNERSWAELGHSGLLFQKTIHFCSNFPVSWWLGLLNTLFICGDMAFAIVWSFFVRLRRPLPWPCWRAEAMLSTPNIITYCLSSPNQSIAFKALYLKSLRVLLKIIKFESCFAALICTRIWWCNVIRLANFGQLYCSYMDTHLWKRTFSYDVWIKLNTQFLPLRDAGIMLWAQADWISPAAISTDSWEFKSLKIYPCHSSWTLDAV